VALGDAFAGEEVPICHLMPSTLLTVRHLHGDE
jgi:hypothetical protein